MDKQEALQVLAKYLPPPVRREFLQSWWQWQKEDEAQVRALGNAHAASDEPWLEDCPHCKGAHLMGTIDMCPLNPANKPITAYQAMEAALQALSGQILSLRTELLVIKAEIMKEDEQEYEDTRKYMEYHYTGGE